jgi:hypothetical protein
MTKIFLGNIKGVTGDSGPAGPKGDTGDAAYNIKGSYDDYETFIAEHSSGSTGDAYIVDGYIYLWDSISNSWKNAGKIKGDTGATGPQGPAGESGPAGSEGRSGWKIPCDEITSSSNPTLTPTDGYRIAQVNNTNRRILEYDSASETWKEIALETGDIIPVKLANSKIQMYAVGENTYTHMGVSYGVFGNFKFMTQSQFDSLVYKDEDAIYFIRADDEPVN